MRTLALVSVQDGKQKKTTKTHSGKEKKQSNLPAASVFLGVPRQHTCGILICVRFSARELGLLLRFIESVLMPFLFQLFYISIKHTTGTISNMTAFSYY